MLSLTITSSTALVGVAVAEGSNVLAHEQVLTDRRHAEELTPMIERLTAQAGVQLRDLDRLGVDIGPGRFTGMRVGLATVKTLAWATNAEVVPFTSFQMLFSSHPGELVCVIDARRNEVFVQRRSASGEVDLPRVMTPDDLTAELPGEPPATLLGDGADRYAEIFAGQALMANQHPDAAAVAPTVASQQAVPAQELTPLYLRDADVQINIKTRPEAGQS